MPLLDELFLEREIVLDDAVVHDDEVAGAVRVRMCVHIRRTPVRRPARMADADRALRHVVFDLLPQRRETAHALLHADILAVIDGDARRVIAAVLELREPLEQELRRLALSDIAHDSTHKDTSSLPRTSLSGYHLQVSAAHAALSGGSLPRFPGTLSDRHIRKASADVSTTFSSSSARWAEPALRAVLFSVS